MEVRVPDIGDFKNVAVIELLVKPGDTVALEQSLFTVESDKASMEIPSPAAGVLKELKVKIGDTVNIGDLVAILEGVASAAAPAATLHLLQQPLHPHQPGSSSRHGGRSPSGGYGYGGSPRPPARLCHAGPAPRQPLGAQVRPRAGRAAGRSQGLRPQGSHHPG